MAPLVRSGRPGDGASVLALWREAGAHPSKTDDLESLERLLDEHPGALIVAVEDSAFVGSVIAGWDGWRGSIYRLAVAPSHRRHGLAGRLVREAELRFERLGAIRLNAIAVAADDHATAFWRSTGWDEQSGRIRFVKDG